MAGFNGDLDARDNADLRRVLADAMPDTFRWLLNARRALLRADAGAAAHASRACTMCCRIRVPSSRISARRARRAGVDIRLRRARQGTGAARQSRVVGDRLRDRRGSRAACARAAASCWRPAISPAIPNSKRKFMGPQEAKIDGVNVDRDRRRAEARVAARRPHRQRRSRARPGTALRAAAAARIFCCRLPPWPAARQFDGLVARIICRVRCCGLS